MLSRRCVVRTSNLVQAFRKEDYVQPSMLIEYIPPTLEYHTLLYVFHTGADDSIPVAARALHATRADRCGLYIQWDKHKKQRSVDLTLFDTVKPRYKTAILFPPLPPSPQGTSSL